MNKFITFEGGDGSGKTTLSKKLYEFFLFKEIDAIWTREIGGTEIAEKLRDMILTNKLLNNTELLLILAARNEHIEKVIKPALQNGKIVICDRFVDSTAAYQSENEYDIKKIYYLHRVLFDNFFPDKTIFLKLEPQDGLKRVKKRGELDKFEKKDLTFHKKIAANYHFINNNFPERICEIDASERDDIVFENILNALDL
ncbi:MAG: dTMP kinase [Rickettsiaceae bacterium]|nr:dTMP kinase [Rickettsiaceae bacterium]